MPAESIASLHDVRSGTSGRLVRRTEVSLPFAVALPVTTDDRWSVIWTGVVGWLATAGWRIALILVILYAAHRFGRQLIGRAMSLTLRDGDDTLRQLSLVKRRNTLTALFTATLTTLLSIIALLMVFKQLGLEIAPILASAGVVGLAVGFGAQSLVKDLITGAFIILENQFALGDIIRVGGASGTVEQINLRTVVLRDTDGTVSIIPNSEITRVQVLTKGWSRLVLDVGVAYESDLDHVFEVMRAVLNQYTEEHPEIVLDKPELQGVESLGDSAVVVRALVKTIPSKQWECGRVIRKRVKEAFEQAGIELPFPQRTIRIIDERPKDVTMPDRARGDAMPHTKSPSPRETDAAAEDAEGA